MTCRRCGGSAWVVEHGRRGGEARDTAASGRHWRDCRGRDDPLAGLTPQRSRCRARGGVEDQDSRAGAGRPDARIALAAPVRSRDGTSGAGSPPTAGLQRRAPVQIPGILRIDLTDAEYRGNRGGEPPWTGLRSHDDPGSSSHRFA